MPVPVERDLAKTRAVLVEWLEKQLPDAHDVAVADDLSKPTGVGNANETILATVSYRIGSARCEERFVIRLGATVFDLFLDAGLDAQVDVLRALEACSAPTPKVRWYEKDATWLGAPFFVMERFPGRVPTDHPSYNSPGTWTHDLDLASRHRLWTNAFTTWASMHVDERKLTAERVLSTGLAGRSGLQEQIDYWQRYIQWSHTQSPRRQAISKWLDERVPNHMPTALSWGDARLENLIFDDQLNCTGILDWEMVNLGGPLMDLAWWLLFDRFVSQTVPEGRLRGLGDRAQSLALWDTITGISIDDLRWYEVFAAHRLSAIIARMQLLYASLGTEMGAGDAPMPAEPLDQQCLGMAEEAMEVPA
jgi:aminoglycoside phosphotransferase (APT) family kinase protein